MKPTDELFNLIKSLTPHEKRYFKLFASLNAQKKNPEYIKLFDAIDSMATYNEELIKKKYSEEKFSNQFAYHKNYLTHAIIKSMGLFHAEKKVVLQLLDLLKEIEFLFSKGQMSLCKKWIKKGITECELVDQFALLNQFLSWQQKINQHENKFQLICEIAEEKILVNSQLSQEYNYKQSYYELMKIAYQSGLIFNNDDKIKLNTVCKKFSLNEALKNTTLEGAYYYYASKSLENLLLNNDEKRIEYAAKALETLESSKNYVSTNIKLYIAAINNLSIAYGKAKQYDMRMRSILKLKVFIDANDDIIDKTTKATSILNILDATLSTYLITDKIEKALSLEYEIADAVNKYFKDALLTNSLDLMYNMAYTFFDAKKFEKSLDWLNKIISLYQAGYRDDLFIACRLLSLIIHFELKNEYYLENSIESTTKYISNKKRLTYSEEVLLIFLKKTIRAKSEANTVEALKELQQKIIKIPKSKQDNIISYIDIQQWASEKLKEMQYNKV